MTNRQNQPMIALAEGCRSASSPCNHQKVSPSTLCEACQPAASSPDRVEGRCSDELIDELRDTLNFIPEDTSRLCNQAADAIERLQAELDKANKWATEQTNLATKSIRRIAELAEPGAIGAFASRDHWKARAESAEAKLKQAREALEFIRDGYDNHDINHVDFRVVAYSATLDALSDEKGKQP